VDSLDRITLGGAAKGIRQRQHMLATFERVGGRRRVPEHVAGVVGGAK
jgi:hypothetical protein